MNKLKTKREKGKVKINIEFDSLDFKVLIIVFLIGLILGVIFF